MKQKRSITAFEAQEVNQQETIVGGMSNTSGGGLIIVGTTDI